MTAKTAKTILPSDNGSGMTGAKAVLIAAGYKIRVVDIDKGLEALRSLLTDATNQPKPKGPRYARTT